VCQYAVLSHVNVALRSLSAQRICELMHILHKAPGVRSGFGKIILMSPLAPFASIEELGNSQVDD
jgi:hypothetical protein